MQILVVERLAFLGSGFNRSGDLKVEIDSAVMELVHGNNKT
jgi:hypothetical protein